MTENLRLAAPAYESVLSSVRARTPCADDSITLWRGRRASIWHLDRSCSHCRARHLDYVDVDLDAASAKDLCRRCLTTAPVALRASLVAASLPRHARKLTTSIPHAEKGDHPAVLAASAATRSAMAEVTAALVELRLDAQKALTATTAASAAVAVEGTCELIADALCAVELVEAAADALNAVATDRHSDRVAQLARYCAARVGSETIDSAPIPAPFDALRGLLGDIALVRRLRLDWASVMERSGDRDAAAAEVDAAIEGRVETGPRSLSQLPDLAACPDGVPPLRALMTSWEAGVRAEAAACRAVWEDLWEASEPNSDRIVTVVINRELPAGGAFEQIRAVCPHAVVSAGPSTWSLLRVPPAVLAFMQTSRITASSVAVLPEHVATDPTATRSLLSAAATLAVDGDLPLSEYLAAAALVS